MSGLKNFIEPMCGRRQEENLIILKNYVQITRTLQPLDKATFFPHIQTFCFGLIKSIYRIEEEDLCDYFLSFVKTYVETKKTQNQFIDDLRNRNQVSKQLLLAKINELLGILFPKKILGAEVPQSFKELEILFSDLLTNDFETAASICRAINICYHVQPYHTELNKYVKDPETLSCVAMCCQLLERFQIVVDTPSFELLGNSL